MKSSEVGVGDALPELLKHPTTRQLVQYAGASGDFYEIHYDQALARSLGLPDVILHGLLKAAFLGELVTGWGGPGSSVRKFEVSYRGLDSPGRPYRCAGLVKAIEGRLVELEVWGENAEGNRTTLGTATIELAE